MLKLLCLVCWLHIHSALVSHELELETVLILWISSPQNVIGLHFIWLSFSVEYKSRYLVECPSFSILYSQSRPKKWQSWMYVCRLYSTDSPQLDNYHNFPHRLNAERTYYMTSVVWFTEWSWINYFQWIKNIQHDQWRMTLINIMNSLSQPLYISSKHWPVLFTASAENNFLQMLIKWTL